jgi:bifunctional UDP-N-acetylglucosamine pyrophosphorylase / glucosamine-1-phosphate N-acetyltransferase
MNDLVALVLAAGQSRRMKSSLSKVLHPIAGRPLLHYPVATALELGARRVVVVTSPSNDEAIARYLGAAFTDVHVRTAVQAVAQGTGDAVRVGLGGLGPSGFERERSVVILYGDVPLISAAELAPLVYPYAGLAMATCRLDDPTGYGRILRDETGRAVAIREHKDLKGDAEREINEINAGLYCAPLAALRESIANLSNDNAQREYYLTDIVPYFAARAPISTIPVGLDAVRGVNDRVQLFEAQEAMNRRLLDAHRRDGASIAAGVAIDDAVRIGVDVVIGANCQLRGRTVLGERVVLDVGCVLTDVVLEAGTHLPPYTVLRGEAPSLS